MTRKTFLRPAAFVALTLVPPMAQAGGMAPAIMEMAPAPIVEETKQASSSSGLIIPLILIALIALAMSKSGTTPKFT